MRPKKKVVILTESQVKSLLDKGWKIVLGRGLDIYQKTGGYADITDYILEGRLCKASEISFVKR